MGKMHLEGTRGLKLGVMLVAEWGLEGFKSSG